MYLVLIKMSYEKKMYSVLFYMQLFLSIEILIMQSTQMINSVKIVFIIKSMLFETTNILFAHDFILSLKYSSWVVQLIQLIYSLFQKLIKLTIFYSIVRY